MADPESPRLTPKRKRGDGPDAPTSPVTTSSRFVFDFGPDRADDGSASPRSKVAHKFRGLALDGGGGVADPADDDEDDRAAESARLAEDDELAVRKRQRVPDAVMKDAEGAPVVATGITDAHGKTVPEPRFELAAGQTDTEAKDAEQSRGTTTRPSESKSRARKRAGTPPLTAHKAGRTGSDNGEAMEIVEPIRAALTWHEDEITVYDPDDEDDDGTGINGVGFRPSPAVAYAREQTRKKQLAEYRKREENEARAKRSRRRRGSPRPASQLEPSSPGRKVRFMDAETGAVATTG